MNKTKIVVSLLLVAVLAAVSLVGCSPRGHKFFGAGQQCGSSGQQRSGCQQRGPCQQCCGGSKLRQENHNWLCCLLDV